MVVPLKLTQFYGHGLPRPRIYPDVKFNEHRVDPPPSVNEALLSWASDAHWSMGGISFKRLRTQGKVEGNVRRLRAYLEDDEEKSTADAVKFSVKDAIKPADGVENTKSPTRKEGIRSAKKRKYGEVEVVEATPARKLRRKVLMEEGEESPVFVPATEERPREREVGAKPVSVSKVRSQAKPVPATREAPSKGERGVLRSVAREAISAEAPSGAATGGRPKGRLFTASTGPFSRSRGVHSAASQSFKGSSDGERLSRSARKAITAESTPMRPSKKTTASRARKVILASDGESSDSDDGLEEFLREKGRTLRRSIRLVKAEDRDPLQVVV